MNRLLIGIDMGGTNVKIGCFGPRLKLLCKTSVPVRQDISPAEYVETVKQATQQMLAGNGSNPDDIEAVGIGAPGPSDIAAGVVLTAPNLPKFRNVPLRQMFSDSFARPAAFENDANAACWGEYIAGAGKGIKDMVFFTLGTGIGGGVISNGKLVHGFGDNAAELGHIIVYPDGRLCSCGQKGCAEAYASANATAARAAEAVSAGTPSGLKKILEQNGRITCKDVFEQALAGDELAKDTTETTAKTLGLLCVNMFHATGPERIIFSGGMTAAGEQLLGRIRHFFKQYIWPLKPETLQIVFASLGDDAGITGAAAIAKSSV